MVDFEFYANCYLGSRIPQKAFAAAMQRAEDFWEHFSKVFRVESAGEDASKMALCAMAEEIYEHHRRGDVHTTQVGDVRVQYTQPEGCLQRRLLQCAGIYVDIYRGVDV